MFEEEPAKIFETPNEHGFLRGGASRLGRRPHRLAFNSEGYLRWTTRRRDTEYPNTILEVDADIWHRDSPERIGYFRGYVLLPFEEDLSTFELHNICDADSQELMDFASALYSANIEVQELCDGGEILFAELLEILPNWRGRALGVSSSKAIASEMGIRRSVSTCVFQPVPLQFAAPFPKTEVAADVVRAHEAAKQRLAALYRKHLGACKLARGSDYYFFRVT